PYHALVPTFGDWGFVMGSSQKRDVQHVDLAVQTKFLKQNQLEDLFHFEKDMVSNDVEVNMMDRPVLLDYYLKGWKYYAR
ncbi:MAG: spermidine synthase, partial [Ghiorsea sp.]